MTADSIAAWNAAQSEFYATHDRTVEAGPEWDDLTAEEQAEELALGYDSSWAIVMEKAGLL